MTFVTIISFFFFFYKLSRNAAEDRNKEETCTNSFTVIKYSKSWEGEREDKKVKLEIKNKEEKEKEKRKEKKKR